MLYMPNSTQFMQEMTSKDQNSSCVNQANLAYARSSRLSEIPPGRSSTFACISLPGSLVDFGISLTRDHLAYARFLQGTIVNLAPISLPSRSSRIPRRFKFQATSLTRGPTRLREIQLHQGAGLRGKTSLVFVRYLGISLARDAARLSEIARFQPI
jgi:hypothetical protein